MPLRWPLRFLYPASTYCSLSLFPMCSWKYNHTSFCAIFHTFPDMIDTVFLTLEAEIISFFSVLLLLSSCIENHSCCESLGAMGMPCPINSFPPGLHDFCLFQYLHLLFSGSQCLLERRCDLDNTFMTKYFRHFCPFVIRKLTIWWFN